MVKIQDGISQSGFHTMSIGTLADIRANAKALQQQLAADKFEAKAFKASPEKVLFRHNAAMVDIQELGLCVSCRTTCGVTNACRRSGR